MLANMMSKVIDKKNITFEECYRTLNSYRATARKVAALVENDDSLSKKKQEQLQGQIDAYLSKLTTVRRDLSKGQGNHSSDTKVRDVMVDVTA